MAKVTKTSKTKPSHPKILKMFRRRKILVKKRILLKLNLKRVNILPIHRTVPFFQNNVERMESANRDTKDTCRYFVDQFLTSSEGCCKFPYHLSLPFFRNQSRKVSSFNPTQKFQYEVCVDGKVQNNFCNFFLSVENLI